VRVRAIREAVPVRVGDAGVRAEDRLLLVGQAVAVRIGAGDRVAGEGDGDQERRKKGEARGHRQNSIRTSSPHPTISADPATVGHPPPASGGR